MSVKTSSYPTLQKGAMTVLGAKPMTEILSLYEKDIINVVGDCLEQWVNKFVREKVNTDEEFDVLLVTKINELYNLMDVLDAASVKLSNAEQHVVITDKRVLSLMMEICLASGLINDEGDGKRFCFNSLETCHCLHPEQFEHFNKNLIDLVLLLAQSFINLSD